VNAIGEGPSCGFATPVIPADSCHLPGLLTVDDLNVDGSDIRQLTTVAANHGDPLETLSLRRTDTLAHERFATPLQLRRWQLKLCAHGTHHLVDRVEDL